MLSYLGFKHDRLRVELSGFQKDTCQHTNNFLLSIKGSPKEGTKLTKNCNFRDHVNKNIRSRTKLTEKVYFGNHCIINLTLNCQYETIDPKFPKKITDLEVPKPLNHRPWIAKKITQTLMFLFCIFLGLMAPLAPELQGFWQIKPWSFKINKLNPKLVVQVQFKPWTIALGSNCPLCLVQPTFFPTRPISLSCLGARY